MSKNPILLCDAHGGYYTEEINGPRKYLVKNTKENIDFVRAVYHDKVKPYLIDFDTVEVLGFKVLENKGKYQKVNVRVKYKDPLGKEHNQTVEMKRFNLYEALLEKLTLDEDVLLLKCDNTSDIGIMIAIKEQTDVALNLAEIAVIETAVRDVKLLVARHNAYGWFGTARVRLL